mmetsp:Transcript_93966/g.169726  ORF Transcript_93966/g.169726 Transcript_93966/m.169726 type:complete len:200 (-) Transcript_93966:1096-1695(-)
MVLLIADGHGFQRIFSNFVQLGNHALDGLQDKPVGILRECHGTKAQKEANEQRLCRVQNRLELRTRPAIEDEDEDHLVVFITSEVSGNHDGTLVVAKVFGASKVRLTAFQQGHAPDVAIQARRSFLPRHCKDALGRRRQVSLIVVPVIPSPAYVGVIRFRSAVDSFSSALEGRKEEFSELRTTRCEAHIEQPTKATCRT